MSKSNWFITIPNVVTLIIVGLFVSIFIIEFLIVIFDKSIQNTNEVFIAFTALLFTFSFISIEYSNNEFSKKYKLNGQFYRASQNFTISVVLIMFIYVFSGIELLSTSKNHIIISIWNYISSFSPYLVLIGLILLVFELSTGTWILLKATMEAYEKYYNETKSK